MDFEDSLPSLAPARFEGAANKLALYALASSYVTSEAGLKAPPTTLEKLAGSATIVEKVAGDVIVAEGDPGDSFYAIADGEVEVTQGGRVQRTLGPGDHFGEIALLRGSTRTATVIATGPTRLVAMDGRDFVDALASSEAAYAVGWRVTDDLLSRDEAARQAP